MTQKAQVNAQLLNQRQLDAALALLGWCDEALAAAAKSSAPTISRFRMADGAGPRRQATGQLLRDTLERAGVRFTARGVEVRKGV